MQDLVDFLNLNKNQLPLDLNLFVTVRRNVVTVLGPVKKLKFHFTRLKYTKIRILWCLDWL